MGATASVRAALPPGSKSGGRLTAREGAIAQVRLHGFTLQRGDSDRSSYQPRESWLCHHPVVWWHGSFRPRLRGACRAPPDPYVCLCGSVRLRWAPRVGAMARAACPGAPDPGRQRVGRCPRSRVAGARSDSGAGGVNLHADASRFRNSKDGWGTSGRLGCPSQAAPGGCRSSTSGWSRAPLRHKGVRL